MNIHLNNITPEQFATLETTWKKAIREKQLPYKYLGVPEDIDAVIAFLYLLQSDNEVIIDGLKKHGVIKEITTKELTKFEKSIQTIARSDQIDKLLNPERANKKSWMNTKLSTFLSYVIPEGNSVGEMAAKKLYAKYRHTLQSRLDRIKTSPKVYELEEKHPDVDVRGMIAVSILHGKIELNNDDLTYIDNLISIQKLQKPKH